MTDNSIKVTFLGTGTSQGIPLIGCRCAVCTSANAKDKRLRSSILVETAKTRVCIDSGPDFRQQLLRERTTRLDAVVYTHEHKDHIAIAVRPDAPNLAAWIDVVLDNVGLQLKPSGIFTLGTDWTF